MIGRFWRWLRRTDEVIRLHGMLRVEGDNRFQAREEANALGVKLDEARQEVAALHQALDLASDPEVVRLEVEKGGLDLTLRHPSLVLMMADQFRKIMDAHGADNVLEFGVRHPRPPAVDIMVSLQKKPGKTPMDLVEEARREAALNLADANANASDLLVARFWADRWRKAARHYRREAGELGLQSMDLADELKRTQRTAFNASQDRNRADRDAAAAMEDMLKIQAKLAEVNAEARDLRGLLVLAWDSGEGLMHLPAVAWDTVRKIAEQAKKEDRT